MNAELRTIPEALDERAAECGEQTAYIFDGVRYTWRDCERQAVAVYKDGFPAFIRALNRLSSYAYCLMCEQKAKQEEEI
mgnify:CR=1 FL=1